MTTLPDGRLRDHVETLIAEWRARASWLVCDAAQDRLQSSVGLAQPKEQQAAAIEQCADELEALLASPLHAGAEPGKLNVAELAAKAARHIARESFPSEPQVAAIIKTIFKATSRTAPQECEICRGADNVSTPATICGYHYSKAVQGEADAEAASRTAPTCIYCQKGKRPFISGGVPCHHGPGQNIVPCPSRTAPEGPKP